jgi:hypothetical protein
MAGTRRVVVHEDDIGKCHGTDHHQNDAVRARVTARGPALTGMRSFRDKMRHAGSAMEGGQAPPTA